jgi:hypothetical protein
LPDKLAEKAARFNGSLRIEPMLIHTIRPPLGCSAALRDGGYLKTTVSGPVQIGFGLEPSISIGDIAGEDDEMPADLKGVTAKTLSLRISVLPLLMGRLQLNSLSVDGLKLDIEIPVGGSNTNPDDDMDIAGFVHDFVRSRFAGDVLLRDAELNYVNQETGFTIRYAFDNLGSSPSDSGGVTVAGTGRINGEPWKDDGKIDPPGDNQDQRSFSFTGVQAGLTSAFAGTYTLSDSEDTIDAVATGNAPELTKLLDVYDIKSDFEGSGTVSARFTGTLNAPKMNIPVALGDPEAASVRRTGALEQALGGDKDLKAAIDHALGVERHRLPVHHLGEPLVLHDLGVDAVAMGARLEGDPGEGHRLVGLELDAAREGRELSHLDVIGDAFAKLERAVLAPNLAGFPRHAPIGLDAHLLDGHHEAVDIVHL